MTTYEMLWDCKYCGTQKLLGLTHRHCPTCGAPQDATARYFPSEADKVAADAHELVGADVVCPACQEANSKKSKHCFNCGSPLDGSASVRTREDRVFGEGSAPPEDNKQAALLEARSIAGATIPGSGPGTHPAPPAKARKSYVPLIVGGLILSLIGLVLLNFFWTKAVQVEAVSQHWVREISIEELSDVRDSAWCDQLPGDARVIGRSLETRSTRRVPDGQTCTNRQKDNGDGSFSQRRECTTKYRSEPVKDMRCTYLATRWHFVRTETAQGNAAQPPTWPAPRLTRVGQCIGCEREGSRKERYQVTLRDPSNGDEDTCELPQATWQSMTPGKRIEAERRMVGGIVCGDLTTSR